MSDDILDRAQQTLKRMQRHGPAYNLKLSQNEADFLEAAPGLVAELVDALRAARTENERMYGFIHRLGHTHMCEHPHAAPGDTWQCPNCQRTWKALEWGPLDIRWETTR